MIVNYEIYKVHDNIFFDEEIFEGLGSTLESDDQDWNWFSIFTDSKNRLVTTFFLDSNTMDYDKYNIDIKSSKDYYFEELILDNFDYHFKTESNYKNEIDKLNRRFKVKNMTVTELRSVANKIEKDNITKLNLKFIPVTLINYGELGIKKYDFDDTLKFILNRENLYNFLDKTGAYEISNNNDLELLEDSITLEDVLIIFTVDLD